MLSDLEERSGLMLRSGQESYEFAHKSIQEHLTAEHLVKLPRLPESRVMGSLPNESAIAVAISSDSSDYLAELCLNRVLPLLDAGRFLRPFLERLALERPDFTPSLEAGSTEAPQSLPRRLGVRAAFCPECGSGATLPGAAAILVS